MTSCRPVNRRWDIPFQPNLLHTARCIHFWDGREEGTRIGMLRRIKNLLGCSVLYDAPQIHHRYFIGEVFHNGKVVRDEQVGES